MKKWSRRDARVSFGPYIPPVIVVRWLRHRCVTAVPWLRLWNVSALLRLTLPRLAPFAFLLCMCVCVCVCRRGRLSRTSSGWRLTNVDGKRWTSTSCSSSSKRSATGIFWIFHFFFVSVLTLTRQNHRLALGRKAMTA